MRGDLSNITASPSVLDTKSAAALVLGREALDIGGPCGRGRSRGASTVGAEMYAGRSEAEGLKKPINAFLGELFLARWEDDRDQEQDEVEVGITRLVSEQVSHHPPGTACRVWNEEHGVTAEGYTRQEITFTGSVNIQQIGHAKLHLARHHETYLIPLPDIKINGILQVLRTRSYTAPTTSRARVGILQPSTSTADEVSSPALTGSTLSRPAAVGRPVRYPRLQTERRHREFDVTTARTTPLITDPIEEQDPWESRRAIENGQREMRKTDSDGRNWKRLFFEPISRADEVVEALAGMVGLTLDPEDTVAAWKFRRREWREGAFGKPYHGNLMPDNSTQARAGEGGEKVVVDGVHLVARSQRSLLSGEQRDIPPARTSSQINGSPPSPQPETSTQTEVKKSIVRDMNAREKAQVEEFLRDKHSSKRR
ncbi:uncharacterized protein Z519_04010 [Cladophialophora bantiana CBS 173.52]|uniref:Uncharacterized protein n=1 Tax=Cladophialophora bantiana (strain ATCC 10958 / CBS 173.52 / CDC B-1940 / NIH 8579) TaxID=1442370 RepID=A0A0D2EZS7_CLAB1|nr:uncharacterized protein Z519_04010 [Cladophialophora bantiana CBS 173.52]KIW95426.1 hypothetical protein Z519_04010 [Cladophialophora bantiana CBS 173.52]